MSTRDDTAVDDGASTSCSDAIAGGDGAGKTVGGGTAVDAEAGTGLLIFERSLLSLVKTLSPG